MDITSRVEQILARSDAEYRDPELRERVIDELMQLGLETVPALLAKRKPEPRYPRWGAIYQALLQLGKPILPDLLNVIAREGADYTTVGLLAKLADERHVPLLIQLMDKYWWSISHELVRIGSPAVEPLLAKLNAADVPRKRAIIDIFCELHDARTIPSLAEYLDVPELRERAALALARIGAPSVPPIINILLTTPEQRLIAMSILVQIGGASVQPLLDVLNTVDKAWRLDLIKLLGYIGHAFAVPSLIQFMSDEDKAIRIESMLALGRTGDFRAVKPLSAALNDTDSAIRQTAEKALKWRRDEQGVNGLVRAMFRLDGNRHMTAQFLGYVRDDRAVDVLKWFLIEKYANQWENPTTQINRALANIRGEKRKPAPYFDAVSLEQLQHIRSSQRAAAVRRMGYIGDKHYIKPLRAALRDMSARVRLDACYALCRLGVEDEAALMNEHELPFMELNNDVVRWFATATLDAGMARYFRALQAKLPELTDTEHQVLESLSLVEKACTLRKLRAQVALKQRRDE